MSTPKLWDVVTVGDLFLDLILSGFSSWPQPGEEVFATRFAREVGGGAAITACGLARLGLNVGLLGLVGRDDGEWIVRRLAAFRVDTRLIVWHEEEPTAITVSVSRADDRAFFTYMGANRALPDTLADERVWGELTAARHVHLACALDPSLLKALIRFAHEHGTRLSLDVGWHPRWLGDPESRRALRDLDLFFPNEREAMYMTGAEDAEGALRALAEAGVSTIALKRGPSGALLFWKGELFAEGPYPIEPLDPTGAGDCFNAGFLYAWMRGEHPERCLKIANICGALSTRKLGGVAAFPTPEELDSAWRAISEQQR